MLLKTLDRKIVLNSVILKWDIIKKEFEERIQLMWTCIIFVLTNLTIGVILTFYFEASINHVLFGEIFPTYLTVLAISHLSIKSILQYFYIYLRNARKANLYALISIAEALICVADEKSMTNLAKQFFLKTSKRKYHALVWGILKDEKGTINERLARDPKNRLIMSVPEDNENGKSAISHYKVIERFNYVTLIECQLETGRTHQIRAHMKHIGHPIFNDGRYGGDKILKGTIFNKYKQFVLNSFKLIPRQALHAKSLGFVHPVSKKELNFECNLPDDFEQCLEKWRNYSSL